MPGQVRTTLQGLEHLGQLSSRGIPEGWLFWDTQYTWIPGHLNIPVCPWQWQLYLKNWQNWKSLKINFWFGGGGCRHQSDFWLYLDRRICITWRKNKPRHPHSTFVLGAAVLCLCLPIKNFQINSKWSCWRCHLSRHSLQWHWRAGAVHLVESNIIVQGDFF